MTIAMILFFCLQAPAQIVDSMGIRNPVGKQTVLKPEIFTSGFIDIINNGQLNASARLIRLQIGEPGKFAIPLSLYSGVSNNNFQPATTPAGNRSNEHLVNQYINPLSGLINLSADEILYFGRHPERLTRTGWLLHGGVRILTGYTGSQAGKPVNFLNTFCTGGLYFQTGAWEKNNAGNMGIFWAAARYILCKSNPAQLKQFIPAVQTNGFYHGWSVGWGVEINKLVNIKLVYYRYVKKPEIEYSLPIYQFSFQYSLR